MVTLAPPPVDACVNDGRAGSELGAIVKTGESWAGLRMTAGEFFRETVGTIVAVRGTVVDKGRDVL